MKRGLPVIWSCIALLQTQFLPAAGGLCFSDGIPESQRINLTTGDGESYPVGIWVPTWAAAVATSAVMEILVAEKLGFLTVTGGGSSSLDGFFAMAGCETPTEIADRKCGRKKTYYHLHLEGWTDGYRAQWSQLQEDYPDTAAEIVGSMGYQGLTGQYISREVIETAYAQEGLPLQFYRAHNVSWSNPAKYFDNISAFKATSLKRCNETRLMETKAMEDYLWVTGDWDGVDNTSGKLVGRCFSEHFWFAPSCRADPLACYPYINAGPGYEYEHWMQKSTMFNIPLVIVVAKLWSDFTTLPTQVKSSFYWWQPDPTFLSLDAVRTVFEPFDRAAQGRGILLTGFEATSVDKYASFDLKSLAPTVYELLSAFSLDLNLVNELMTDQMDSGDTPDVVACRWLKANKAIWEQWLPDPTECYPQFGLYNEKTKEFVEDREDPSRLTCRACKSGFYSSRLKDSSGVTHVCKPCPPGTAQPSGASLDCQPCPKGEYQDLTASKSCKRCDQGTYQDTQGNSQCKECPADTTTLGLGSAALLECGCKAGRINIANESEAVVCTPCEEGKGLSCPFSSSVQSLKTGQAPLGPDYQPALHPGFYSTMNAPLVVFKCIEEGFCPGGTPEVCSGGRVGQNCAVCPPGETLYRNECTTCNDSTIFFWWFVVIWALCGCTCAYYTTNPRVNAIASARQTGGISVGLAIKWLQTVAIIGMMTVTWPPSVAGHFTTLQVFLLDVDAFSFSCFVSEQASFRYIMKVSCFPLAILWMIGNFFFSRFLPQRLQWQWTKTTNTIGNLIQVGFAVMTTVALESMMCYVHPNGSYSLVKYSSVTCGEGEQVTMMVTGVSLLVIFVIGFLAIVTYATFALPSWSSRMLRERVQSFNFLTYRFRLDKWWFGLPLLLRGPLMSLVVTCATDFVDVQVCLIVLVLTGYALIQATARPWKAPILNWMDLFVSILLIQIAALSGLKNLKVSSFSEFYSQSLLVLLVCTVCTMWFFLAIALVLELFYGLKAKDSAILRVFESRGQDLGEMLVAIARALQQEEVSQATLQRVFDRMNNHDLSRLETSLELLLTEFMDLNTGLQVPSMNSKRWRIQERAISRASVLPTGTAGAALPEDSESKMDMLELDPDLPIPDEFAEPIQGAECLR